MSLFYGDTRYSLRNRKIFLSSLGIDYQNLICAQQVHGNKVKYIIEKDKGLGALTNDTSIPDTDALITDRRNIALAILTADCLPVFLYDAKRAAIGLAHAGWRGSKEAIVAQTLKLMESELNSHIEDIHVGFGPAIRKCCYEVGEEFKDLFPGHLIERGKHYYLDLPEANKRQVLDSGVREENIFDSGVCTSCRNDDFFSYRKEGNSCGRMMSVMMLR